PRCDRADRPLALRRGARPRDGLRRADRPDPAPRLAGPPRPTRPGRRRPPARLLRPPERDEAHRGARARVRAGPGAPPESAPPARRLTRRAPPPAAATPGRRAPRLRPRGGALVADGRVRRDRQPALADHGRDLRQ